MGGAAARAPPPRLPPPPAVGEARFKFEYYSARAPYRCFDGLPFGTVYGAVVAVVVALVSRHGEMAFEHFLCCALPAFLHVLLFLAAQWSVEVRCFVRFKRESEIERATHVKVSPILLDGGQGCIRKVLLVPVTRKDLHVSITYQKRKFVFDSSSRQFERLRFDVSSSLDTYLASTGLSDEDVSVRANMYGPNVFDIPLPTFVELFQEHAVAPFFVFQIFCVLLWLMDDYWYYSLFTLVMLIVLECQAVQRRLGDVAELRAMRIPPRPFWVFRENAWRVITSDQLLPGDLIALMRQVAAACPCDALLLQGNVLVNEAMLTGESVPQMKVAASVAPDSPELAVPLDMKGLHKQHIVSAGTYVLTHQNVISVPRKTPGTYSSPAAIGLVLRTGFDTTQGKLCRTILFSAERVTVTSREAFCFIMVLLGFALVASSYVLYDGLVVAPTRPDEPARSNFKLFLSVSHILTSVVPPEFPIMLSLAVTLSLLMLLENDIYCIEPFRMPLAGQIDTCCFDKTGTLTSDSYEVDGVYGLPGGLPATVVDGKDGACAGVARSQSLPFLTAAVMAACNGLTLIDGEVVGDPLEQAALREVRWHMLCVDVVLSKVGKSADRLQVLRRWPFASELQRTTVVVRHQSLGDISTGDELDRVLVLVKGSCEVLLPRLRDAPENFGELQQGLAKSGLRVLCLAAKVIKHDACMDAERLDRNGLEANLEFCGLLGLRNAEKPFTVATVRQLRGSYHRVIMITGDSPETACQVAIRVAMVDRPFLLLELAPTSADETSDGDGEGRLQMEWRFRDDTSQLTRPFDIDRVESLAFQHALCVPGWSLARLEQDQLWRLAPLVTVFARVSPQQKEQIVLALNRQSVTMMVGDGTNDVGALKHAHVGVSLLTCAGPRLWSVPAVKHLGRPAQPDLDGQLPLVRLGDASIASPFTHKGDSVKCGVHILRSGRATLATVLMMYKILGLNSVMSAFAFSALTLDGVKLGDLQTSIESLFTSMCFFIVSRSAPAKQLAKQTPISSVFAWSVLVSLALQLVVHSGVLYYGWARASSLRAKNFRRDLEGEFEPNLTNTVVFELTTAMHASSFLANYDGLPFVEPLSSNRALACSLGAFVAAILALAAEVAPGLNSALSLVPSPSADFRWLVLALVAIDIGLSVLLSRAVRALALWSRGRAAERRARELGLGLACADDTPAAPPE